MTGFDNVGVFTQEKFLAQAIFKPTFFPYKYSTILNLSNSSYLPAYENGTECSETSAY